MRLVYWHNGERGRNASWVIQLLDELGNQVGEAVYSPNKRTLKFDLKSMEEETGLKAVRT